MPRRASCKPTAMVEVALSDEQAHRHDLAFLRKAAAWKEGMRALACMHLANASRFDALEPQLNSS